MDIASSPSIVTCRAIAWPNHYEEIDMNWSKPEFIDWRFGFEITLYIFNR